MCNVSNNYFAHVGGAIAHNFTSESESNFSNFMRGDSTRSFFLFTFKPEKDLNATKPKKNCNLFTHILAQVLKSISKVICNSVCHTIIIYISNGVFPQSFKKATVISIHKSGDTSLVHNFRPISVLLDNSKVVERVLYNKLCSYLSKNKVLHDDQYGFRENGSTRDALLSQT